MDLLKYIVKNSEAGPVDVLVLGKEAAAKFHAGEGTLNDVLAKTASTHGLNRAQIDRVCEVANNATFALKFQTSDDKNITFPVADPIKVAQMTKHKVAAPMELPRQVIRNISNTNPIDNLESLLFGEDCVPAQAKVAHVSYLSVDSRPVGNEQQWSQSIAGQMQHLAAEHAEHMSLAKEALADLTREATQLLLSEDMGYGDIYYALASEVQDEELIKNALAHIHAEVKQRYNGLPLPKTMYKKASGFVTNPEHPLIQCAKEMVKQACLCANLEERIKGLYSNAQHSSVVQTFADMD